MENGHQNGRDVNNKQTRG